MIYEVIPAIIPSLMLSFTILLMITDALNYKPIIVVGSICSVSAWVVLIWFYDSVTLTRVSWPAVKKINDATQTT